MKIIIIGRSTDNDVVINDIKISKHHLQLIQNGNGECSVVDLNSTNGTYVNGKRIIGETCLLPNDQVRIGDTTIQWQNYINSAGAQNVKDQQLSQKKPKPRKRNPIIYIILLVVALLIGGLVCLYFINQAKATKDQETAAIEQQYKNKVEELKAKEDRSLDLRIEAQKAYEQAMKTQIDEDLAKYNKLKNEAEAETKRISDEKAKAEAKAKDEAEAKVKAEGAKAEAEASATAALSAQAEAEAKAEQAEQKAAAATAAAQKAQKVAEETAAITTKFHDEYEKIRDWNIYAVCKNLKTINIEAKSKSDIIKEFYKVDNATKLKITNAIKDTVDKETKKLAKEFNAELGKLTQDQVNVMCQKYNVNDKDALVKAFDDSDNEVKQGIIDDIKIVIKNSNAANNLKGSVSAQDSTGVTKPVSGDVSNIKK